MLRTPLRPSEWLSSVTASRVSLKLETLQPTFSYKIRGALNAVRKLAEAGGGHQALVTASAGNHGRALAHAARDAGIPLTVYAPANAPRTKLDAIGRAGARLELCRDYDEAEARAKAHGAAGGALYISPYSHPDVIAGAGTVALEIFDDMPDVEAIVVPIGGGGLISGIAIACASLASDVAIVGVEVEASCPFTQGLSAGRIVHIDVKPTLADGLAGNLDADTVTFDIVGRHVREIVLAAEAELREAIVGLAREERLIVEGAGAAGVAAVLAGKISARYQRVAVVVSGASIDLSTLAGLLNGAS